MQNIDSVSIKNIILNKSQQEMNVVACHTLVITKKRQRSKFLCHLALVTATHIYIIFSIVFDIYLSG